MLAGHLPEQRLSLLFHLPSSMRVPTQIPPTIFETFPRVVSRTQFAAATNTSRTSIASQSRPFAMSQPNSSSAQQPLSFSNYKIENKDLAAAAGVSLSDSQQVITGSVLDLFAGRPSLRKLSLWLDDATFKDPITTAEGRKQYAAQWYGLKAAFSDIQRLSCQVTSAGNPIEISMKNKYTVAGIGSEQTIDSKVKIWTEGQGDAMRVKKVEDAWGGEINSGPVKDALRKLNSVTVPALVSVPKSIEEEEKGQ